MGLFHVASVLYHTMKLNIANPATGSQMLLEVDDERKLADFMDRKIGQEVPLDSLEEGFAGYQVRISGGLDKQGFPMKQGISTAHRVRVLLGKHPGYFNPKRKGERRRPVRGAIVAQDIAVLNLVLVRQGEQPLPKLDTVLPRRLGPKRASKIRKLFNLSKEDDVRKYVIRRELPAKDGKKPRSKAPKIQRLVTPARLGRKKHERNLKRRWAEKSKKQAAEYAAMLAERQNAARKARESKASKKSAKAAKTGKTDKNK